MFSPIIKQETVQWIDEKETSNCLDKDGSHYNDYMCPYDPLQSSNCVNYCDSKLYVLEEVKKEFPEGKCPQPVDSINSRLVFENKEFSKIMGPSDVKQENHTEGLSSIIKQEIDDKEIRFMVKTESPEEHRIMDNAGDTGNHYDVLVIPHEIQCKLCDRTFKNSFDLLQHNNEHINAVPLTLIDNAINELHKCQCCEKYFNNYDNMLAHVRDLHNNKNKKLDLCLDGIKPYRTGKDGEEIKYKCESCDRVYKTKYTLLLHIKKIHYDYGRMFECWCGKQFRSPIHLYRHKSAQHGFSVKTANNTTLKTEFQCDICKKIFKRKWCLMIHITNVHHDYGKTFKCWCGKQFRAPIYLDLHKNRQHGANVQNTNKAALKLEFQCDICKKMFKRKGSLMLHITSIHYDYGKTFECWCGKQFRSPIYLYKHKNRQHDANVKNTHDGALKREFQCDICKKIFKRKSGLVIHITSMHYDYGKTFECWCGKQFRTPIHLAKHKRRYHSANEKYK